MIVFGLLKRKIDISLLYGLIIENHGKIINCLKNVTFVRRKSNIEKIINLFICGL